MVCLLVFLSLRFQCFSIPPNDCKNDLEHHKVKVTYVLLVSLSLKFHSFSLCNQPFLALLDYVSRAHEIEIRLSSVVRPSVASIISEVIAWISFKF